MNKKENEKPVQFLNGSPDYRIVAKDGKIFIFIEDKDETKAISLHFNYLKAIMDNNGKKAS
jgi:predicted type IV restriction endonuclease